MLLQTAIDAISTEGGFDTTSTATPDATIRGWIHEVVQDALGRSKWRKSRIELGPTVAGQAQYALPASVVDLRYIRVNGSRPWLRQSTEQMWEIEAGVRQLLRGTPGVFAPEFELDADQVVSLYPVPTVSGQSILGLAAVLPAAIDAATNAATFDLATLIPEDLARPIVVDGAIAIGLERIMGRADLAGSHVAKKEAAVNELSRRANSRVGHGPTRIQVGRR